MMTTAPVGAPPLPPVLRKYVVMPSGCWEWLGTRRPTGYGRVYFDGRTQPAHRAVWMASGRRECKRLSALERNHRLASEGWKRQGTRLVRP